MNTNILVVLVYCFTDAKKHIKIQYCHKTVMLNDLEHFPQWFDTPRDIKETDNMV